jgi:hypothetical protein
MDTNTVIEIIGLLDARIVRCQKLINEDEEIIDDDRFRYLEASLSTYEKFKDTLQVMLNKQNKVEKITSKF